MSKIPENMRYTFLYGALFLGGVVVAATFVYGTPNLAQLPQSVFHALGDELLGLFIFDRISENIFSGAYAVFDGRIFYPNKNSLAFAENMIFPALIYRLCHAFIESKLLAYHVSLWVMFSLNFIAMVLFTSQFVRLSASVFSGLIFAFSMLRLAQLNHIQLIPQFFFPLVAYCVYRFESTGRAKFLYWGSLFLALQFYCGIQLGMILLVCLLPYVLFRIWKRPKRSGFLVGLIGSGICFAAIVSPIAWIYWKVSELHGVSRSMGEARRFGAHLLSYFSAPPGNFYEHLSRWFVWTEQSHEKHLFVGFIVIGLALWAWKYFRSQKESDSTQKFWKLLLGASVLWCFVLSLGPSGLLYQVIYYLVPGMKAIRVSARFGFGYLFFIAIVAGIGMHVLLSKISDTWKSRRVFSVLIAVFFLENFLSIPFVSIPSELQGVTAKLNEIPNSPLIHFPLQAEYFRYEGDIGNGSNNREAVRMYYSLFHQHPIFNGYSGFRPSSYREMLRLEASGNISLHLLKTAKQQGIRFALIDKNILDPEEKAKWISLMNKLNSIYEDDFTVVIDLSQLSAVGG